MILIFVYIFLQLHDLPDFLSGEERQNTVHIQIQYRRATPPRKESRFLRRSLPSPPPSSLKEGTPPTHHLGVAERKEDRGTYGRLSPTNRPNSPLLRHRSSTPSPVKTPEPLHTSPLNPSPPGKVFSVHSNLSITHHSPGRPGNDLPESPLVPLSLQELPLIPAKQSSRSQSSKSKNESNQLKLEPLTSPRNVKPLPVHTYLGAPLDYHHKTASQPNLQATLNGGGGGDSANRRNGTHPHKFPSNEELTFQFKPHPPQMPPRSPSRLGGSACNLSCTPSLIQNSNSMENLFLQHPHPPLGESGPPLRFTNSVGNLYRHPLGSVGQSASQASLGSDSAHNLLEEGRTTVATLDLYILHQLTDFYHLFCAVWLDLEIVSPTPLATINYYPCT